MTTKKIKTTRKTMAPDAPCKRCSVTFPYDPKLVPLFHDSEGVHPICLECVIETNRWKASVGMEVEEIVEGTYGPVSEYAVKTKDRYFDWVHERFAKRDFW